MTLGQMSTLRAFALEQIEEYAAGNDSFERNRVEWRDNLDIVQGETVYGLTPFNFILFHDGYTVLLDSDNNVIHVDTYKTGSF